MAPPMVSEYSLRKLATTVRPLRKRIATTNGAATNVARMAGGERRLQILRLAGRLFLQRGFRGTTTKEISLAAGGSEAKGFRHFPTKEKLYTATIDHKARSRADLNTYHIVTE